MHHFPMITLVENLKARCEPRKLAPKSRFLNFRVALTIVTDFQKFVHFYLVFKVSETKIFLFHFQRLIVCNYNFIFIPTFVCIPAVLFSYSSNQRSFSFISCFREPTFEFFLLYCVLYSTLLVSATIFYLIHLPIFILLYFS